MSDEKELLQEIIPILLKYDMDTIENCFAYIQKNKKALCDFSAFLDMQDSISKNNKKKNAFDDIIMSVEQDRRPMIKRICKYISTKSTNMDQIQLIAKKYFESREVDISIISNDREEITKDIVKGLCTLRKEDIMQFERLLQMGIINESENNLENWSKVIVKE